MNELLNRLSIQEKMNYLVGTVTISLIGMASFIYFAFNSIDTEYKNLQNNSVKGAMTTLDIQKNLNYVSRTSRDIILGGNYDKNIAKLEDRTAKIRKGFETLEHTIDDPVSLKLIKKAKKSTLLFLDNSNKLVKSLNSNQIRNSKEIIYKKYKDELTPYAVASRKAFAKVVSLKEKELELSTESMGREIKFYEFAFVITGLLVAILIFSFGSMIRVSITRALDKFTNIMEKSAEGHFAHVSIESAPGTEMAIMGNALERLIGQIEQFIEEINLSISGATKGDFSRPISSEGMHGDFVEATTLVCGSIKAMKDQEVKKRRDAMNAELSQLSVGVTESLSVIQDNLNQNITDLKDVTLATQDAASLANESRDSTSAIVNDLNQLIAQVEVNSGGISNLAGQTSDITSVIELITDIADQTNLLALNAAIEAAFSAKRFV